MRNLKGRSIGKVENHWSKRSYAETLSRFLYSPICKTPEVDLVRALLILTDAHTCS